MEVDLKDKTPDIRYLNDMKDVILDKEWLKTAPNLELYYMYRGLKEKDGLRYDITVIPAQMLGKEFTKTKGHKHIGAYPEIYIVLEGEAIYFMQKQTRLAARQEQDIIEDVYTVKAKKGDVVIIPSYYAHVTINPSNQNLKMANWMAIEAESDYTPIQKMQGACYFYTKEGWIKNKSYKQVPELRFEEPKKSIPEDLSFLKG